jgi:hypothetical protein
MLGRIKPLALKTFSAYNSILKKSIEDQNFDVASAASREAIEHKPLGERTAFAETLIEAAAVFKDESFLKESMLQRFISSQKLADFLPIADFRDNWLIQEAIEVFRDDPAKYLLLKILVGDFKDFANAFTGLEDSAMFVPAVLILLRNNAELSCIVAAIKKVFFDETEQYLAALKKRPLPIPAGVKNKVLLWLLDEVNKYATSVLDQKRSKKYNDLAAALVMASKAIESSQGKAAADKFLRGYPEKYPRLKSFTVILQEAVVNKSSSANINTLAYFTS